MLAAEGDPERFSAPDQIRQAVAVDVACRQVTGGRHIGGEEWDISAVGVSERNRDAAQSGTCGCDVDIAIPVEIGGGDAGGGESRHQDLIGGANKGEPRPTQKEGSAAVANHKQIEIVIAIGIVGFDAAGVVNVR